MSRNIKNGLLGESIAARYLESKGHSIIERNYSKRVGEIDIITSKGTVRYFVEVKAVAREMFFGSRADVARENSPLGRIDPAKLSKLRRVIDEYIVTHETFDCAYLVLGVYISELDRRAYCECFVESNI